MARELLAATGEFPNTKGALLILQTEYRHALYDIAANAAEPRPDPVTAPEPEVP
jgi:hypothetical protein